MQVQYHSGACLLEVLSQHHSEPNIDRSIKIALYLSDDLQVQVSQSHLISSKMWSHFLELNF